MPSVAAVNSNFASIHVPNDTDDNFFNTQDSQPKPNFAHAGVKQQQRPTTESRPKRRVIVVGNEQDHLDDVGARGGRMQNHPGNAANYNMAFFRRSGHAMTGQKPV